MTGFQSKRGMAQAKTSMKDEALKLALEALTYIYTETTADEDELIDKAITALRLAIDVQNMASESTYKEALAQPPLPVQPEPSSECNPQDLCAGCRCKYGAQPPLPVQPEQAVQKPLTDEEMKALWAKHGYKSAMCKPFARAIEAAHGIKENT